MPTVQLPLGSASASGTFANVIVFQGNIVRSHVIPYDPQTPAQLEVRSIFRDITKTEKQIGLWGKNALRAVVGSRWYTALYKRVTENSYERLQAAVAVWNTFTAGEQDAWNAAAPWQDTTLQPGLAFWTVIYCIKDWLTLSNAPDYGLGTMGGATSAAALTWYAKNLDDALTAGGYDDDESKLIYAGDWSDIADASALGGSYKQSAATGSPTVSFYFYGTQIILRFLKKVNAGVLQVESYAMGTEAIGQNNSQTLYDQTWSSRGFVRALHYVTITRTGTGSITLDGLTVGNKSVVSVDYAAVQGVSEVPSVCLTLGEAWSCPGGGGEELKYAVYWDKEIWDVGGMHDAPDPLFHIRTLASGRYDLHCEVMFQSTNETWTGKLYVYVNSEMVAFDVNHLQVGTPRQMRLEVNCKLDLVLGQMITVYLSTTRTVATPVDIQPNYTPRFSLELSQRTSLLVENLNVTQNLGASYHSGLQGLDGDDHLHYFNQTRGDARYPLLAHHHDASYSEIGHGHFALDVLGAHLLGATVPASTIYYSAPWKNLLNAIGNQTAWPVGGTLKNLVVAIGSQPASGSLVVTVEVDGSPTALTVTIPAGGGGTYSDNVNEVAFSAGSGIRFKFQNNATGVSGAFGVVAVALEMETE